MSTCQLYRCQLKNYKVDRTPERPTNQVLHKEAEDSLKKMMEIRAQQDQGIFHVTPTSTPVPHQPGSNT